MKIEASTIATTALLVGTPLAFVYLGDRGVGTRGGRAVPGLEVAPSHNDRAIVAGLLRDASLVSLPSLKFLVDATCLGGADAHVFASSNADHLIRMHAELKAKLYGRRARCRGRLLAEEEPEGLKDHYENRVDRIAALRDRQRLRVASVFGGGAADAGEDSDSDPAVVVVADLDVAFLPPVADVLENAAEMVSHSHRVRDRTDVLCSAGVDVHGGYYDTYATVLLPDTFVYPLHARKDPEPREEEDASLIVDSKGFSYKDLLRWFNDVADKQRGESESSPSVPVRSCFGGLAIYRAERWLDFSCSYSAVESADNEIETALEKYANRFDERPCEHVVLHECMRSVDPLTSIAVRPDMRPVWHGGNEAAISANNNLDGLKIGEDWEDVDSKLSRELQAPALISFDPTAAEEDGICTDIATATDECCWDNTTKIWLSERSVADGAPSNSTGQRTYNLCPGTHVIGTYNSTTGTYQGGDAAIEIVNPDVTYRCVPDGGDCILSGGSVHFRVEAAENGAALGDNVRVRDIRSQNANGANILAEAACTDGTDSCLSSIVFKNVSFENSHNDGIFISDVKDERETTGSTVLEVAFVNCLVEDNHMPMAPSGSHHLFYGAPGTSLLFEGGAFANNRVESFPDADGDDTASLIKSDGHLDLAGSCFVNNEVGTAVAVATGTYAASGNGYHGNEYLDAGSSCADGILDSEGTCDSSASSLGGRSVEDQRCAAEHNPGGNPCGPSSCSGDEFVCCNESCGICTPEGWFCTQEVCDDEPALPDSVGGGGGGVACDEACSAVCATGPEQGDDCSAIDTTANGGGGAACEECRCPSGKDGCWLQCNAAFETWLTYCQ